MFDVYSRLIGDVEPMEVLAGAEGLGVGMAAVLTGGALAKCGPSACPTHIVAGVAKTRDGGVAYPAIRVLPTTIFETRAGSTAVSADHLGEAVTLGADALTVTGTTAGGVFVVNYTDGAVGGVVRGSFKEPAPQAAPAN